LSLCAFVGPFAQTGRKALASLQGKQIFLGSPHLNISIETQYSNLPLLIIKTNSARARDFTGRLDMVSSSEATGGVTVHVVAPATSAGASVSRSSAASGAAAVPPGVTVAVTAAALPPGVATKASTPAASIAVPPPPPGVAQPTTTATATSTTETKSIDTKKRRLAA
jgi:hypothetical protein